MKWDQGFGIEFRFAADDTTGSIAGYAAAWSKPDDFRDQWMPGAFADSLRQQKPMMFWMHDQRNPVGVWDDVHEDDMGLRASGHLVLDSTAGRDAHAFIKAGAVRGLSVGFRTVRATKLPNGGRQVHAVHLLEISPVSLPAQSLALIDSVRSSAAFAAPEAAGLAAFIREQAARLKGS